MAFAQNHSYSPVGYAEPTKKKKKGCGCCFSSCLVIFSLFLLITIGGGLAFWYGAKSLTVPDTVVIWTYENVARPKIVEMLPPNLSERDKQKILNASDFGVKRYLSLSSGEKKALLKEGAIAFYYYSNQQIIPPGKIPNLTAFIKETQRAYQRGK